MLEGLGSDFEITSKLFHNGPYATIACKRNIEMTPLCQLEMTLPRGFPGVSGVTVQLMSDGELTRLEVLRDLEQCRLTTEAATSFWGWSAVRCSGR